MSKKKRLAVVDDSLISRESLVRMLKIYLKDISVESFSGGEEVLSSMENGEKYDLILMDGVLNDGPKGPDYTAKILELYPGTAVVGISSDARLRQKFIDAGARNFIPREAKLNDFLETIKNVLGI